MPKQNEEKIVSFTKDQMFDLVADIDNYSKLLPSIKNPDASAAAAEVFLMTLEVTALGADSRPRFFYSP